MKFFSKLNQALGLLLFEIILFISFITSIFTLNLYFGSRKSVLFYNISDGLLAVQYFPLKWDQMKFSMSLPIIDVTFSINIFVFLISLFIFLIINILLISLISRLRKNKKNKFEEIDTIQPRTSAHQNYDLFSENRVVKATSVNINDFKNTETIQEDLNNQNDTLSTRVIFDKPFENNKHNNNNTYKDSLNSNVLHEEPLVSVKSVTTKPQQAKVYRPTSSEIKQENKIPDVNEFDILSPESLAKLLSQEEIQASVVTQNPKIEKNVKPDIVIDDNFITNNNDNDYQTLDRLISKL